MKKKSNSVKLYNSARFRFADKFNLFTLLKRGYIVLEISITHSINMNTLLQFRSALKRTESDYCIIFY